MPTEWTAIALTVIALLGSLAATMVAVFFRFGSFKGSVETKMDFIADEAKRFRMENNEAHDRIYGKVSEHQTRITVLEELDKIDRRDGHG